MISGNWCSSGTELSNIIFKSSVSEEDQLPLMPPSALGDAASVSESLSLLGMSAQHYMVITCRYMSGWSHICSLVSDWSDLGYISFIHLPINYFKVAIVIEAMLLLNLNYLYNYLLCLESSTGHYWIFNPQH